MSTTSQLGHLSSVNALRRSYALQKLLDINGGYVSVNNETMNSFTDFPLTKPIRIKLMFGSLRFYSLCGIGHDK